MNKFLEVESSQGESSQGVQRLQLLSSWKIDNASSLVEVLARTPINAEDKLEVDGSLLESIDTSGAVLLLDKIAASDFALKNFKDSHSKIFSLVEERFPDLEPCVSPKEEGVVTRIGRSTSNTVDKFLESFAFIGRVSHEFGQALLKPKLFRFKELFTQLELVLVDAIPVVCMVTFLIGVVLAYLFASQIQQYGANIFIVDSVGLAITREISPILVAIVVAGRSGSAFTAQLGTMKLNEEVDALSTHGLSPMHVLVIPRVLALMIAMPLLVVLGDIVGIVGGMLVADFQLGITSVTFVDRLRSVLPTKSFCVGILKAPVFAAFIAVIGCRMGLEVKGSARSVGLNTTSTVVQSIVSVILINAMFTIVYVKLGF